MMTLRSRAVFLGLATLAMAQYGPSGQYGPGNNNNNNNPYGGGGGGSGSDQGGSFGGFNGQSFLGDRQKFLIAHGVLAALAFVVFFPLGSILIRLGSFRGAWIVHASFQIFAYTLYIAAFGIGIWLVNGIPIRLIDHYHPVIGIIVFCLLFFQPILGLVHHYKFKKYNRRTIWSYGHLWLGRIVITLGMINGGLGMLLATETGYFVPSKGQIAAYGVVAGVMWLLWVAAAVVGERRRARARTAVQTETSPYKEQYA
ncbi:hypothetical protein BDV95DRAFT_317660 [Massariosphaeria phaeospora]|uniref:Cytochrome b561 domain-containing protein n=1 Tax=Massariosphaeria phaeospora TaxID=100035 RepID=A0A7C8I9E9_9PLEO|nr:hypothetical protein BDV95DRAFT_317660 [Massariosphaeria phaeospora]